MEVYSRVKKNGWEINSLTQKLSESISSKTLKSNMKTLATSAESESRPTLKLKLIKTINYLMLFRFVRGFCCVSLSCTQTAVTIAAAAKA